MINLSKKNSLGAGMYGFYIQLTPRKGIKIVRNINMASYEYLHHKLVYAHREVIAKRYGFKIPKVYQVKQVLVDGKKRYGVVMEHVDGVVLGQYDDYLDEYGNSTEWVDEFVDRACTAVADSHSCNFVVKGKRIYRIDYGWRPTNWLLRRLRVSAKRKLMTLFDKTSYC